MPQQPHLSALLGGVLVLSSGGVGGRGNGGNPRLNQTNGYEQMGLGGELVVVGRVAAGGLKVG